VLEFLSSLHKRMLANNERGSKSKTKAGEKELAAGSAVLNFVPARKQSAFKTSRMRSSPRNTARQKDQV
jgi:hypothetical protein